MDKVGGRVMVAQQETHLALRVQENNHPETYKRWERDESPG